MTMEHDPHEAVQRLARFRKSADAERFFLALNRAIASADLPGPSAASASGLPLIYIVGAPRSGTTLLSQVVSRYLPVGYISNLAARFWLRPSVGIALARTVLGDDARSRIGFKSAFGVTDAPEGPHEFGYFWRHWLRLDQAPTHHLSDTALATLDSAGLRHALEHEILASFGTPVAFKNVICGFHAAFLSSLHPASLFVHITRDLRATAASVLHSRNQRYGAYDTWWSLKPSTYPFFPAPCDAADEVVRQVVDCRREMTAELARPGVHALSVEYGDFCRDPLAVLRRIADAAADLSGCRVTPLAPAIDAFAASDGPALPPDWARRLEDALARRAGA
jgi:LPS sulfotransferase NodH